MVDVEKLAQVRTLITHRREGALCPDAVAAAIVVRDVLPQIAIRFVSYGEELALLKPTPGMLFVDIAPSPERAVAFREVGAIVLDHHETAREVVESFGDNGVYADRYAEPFVSGAMLAFREVWTPLAYRKGQRPGNHYTEGRGASGVHRLAFLAGVADNHVTGSSAYEDACEQAAALAFWPFESFPAPAFDSYGTGQALREMLAIGKVLRRKQKAETTRLVKIGSRFTTERGTRVVVVPSRETADAAEEIGGDADVVVGFSFGLSASGLPTMIVSTRSLTTFDCGEFCKANGGGGHLRAAGFEFELDLEDGHPYAILADVLECWEKHGRGAV